MCTALRFCIKQYLYPAIEADVDKRGLRGVVESTSGATARTAAVTAVVRDEVTEIR